MVEHHGTLLTGDIVELYRAGFKYLPNLALVYAKATNAVHDTSKGDTTAFATASGEASRILPAWTNMRDALQTVMKRTTENIVDTGEALCGIAEDFADQDETAANGIRELMKDEQSPHVEHPASPDDGHHEPAALHDLGDN